MNKDIKAKRDELVKALRYCRNEMEYRLYQIEGDHEVLFTGEMYEAIRRANAALALVPVATHTAESESEKCPRCGDLFYHPKSMIQDAKQHAAEWEEIAKHAGKRIEELLEKNVKLETEVARLKRKLNMFKPYGSDECSACDTGRITLFYANGECISCDPKGYD